jgi:hypothetical protein
MAEYYSLLSKKPKEHLNELINEIMYIKFNFADKDDNRFKEKFDELYNKASDIDDLLTKRGRK